MKEWKKDGIHNQILNKTKIINAFPGKESLIQIRILRSKLNGIKTTNYDL